jgi:adenylate cyclase
MDQVSSWSRDIRFASGLILLLLRRRISSTTPSASRRDAMEVVQDWRYGFWHSWPGRWRSTAR